MAGASIVPVALPDALHEAARVHRVIMLSEAARNLSGLQERARAQLSKALNDALDEGRGFAADDYRRALASRAAMIAAATDWIGSLRRRDRAAGARRGAGRARLDRRPVVLHAGVAARRTGDHAADRVRRPRACRSACSCSQRPGNDAKLLAVAAWCEARLPFRGLV